MRKITYTLLFTIIVTLVNAQRVPPTYTSGESTTLQKGFNREQIFIGGSLAFGFGSNTFNIGGTPEIGYSFNEWLDAGIAVNINYLSIKADPYYNGNIRQRSFNIGGGPFFRVFPIKQFFVQGQFEVNSIKYNYKDYNPNGSEYSLNTNSSSFLAGIGYAQRFIGQSSFYTLIAIDLLTDKYSPYRDYNNTALPIIRAGFNVYLRHKKRK